MLRFVILILLIVFVPAIGAEEIGFSELERFQEKGVYVYREEYSGPTPKDKRPKSFRGYTKMRSQFIALCRALKADGRVDLVQQRIYPHQQKRDDCIACKPLIKTFNKACTLGLKSKKKKAKRRGKKDVEEASVEEDEDEETEIFKERLPSLSVHSLLAEIFNEIVEEPALAEESYTASKLLVTILQPAEKNTPGEREYLTSLVSFIEAPFSQIRREKEKKEVHKEETSTTLDTGWTIQDEKSYSFDTSIEF